MGRGPGFPGRKSEDRVSDDRKIGGRTAGVAIGRTTQAGISEPDDQKAGTREQGSEVSGRRRRRGSPVFAHDDAGAAAAPSPPTTIPAPPRQPRLRRLAVRRLAVRRHGEIGRGRRDESVAVAARAVPGLLGFSAPCSLFSDRQVAISDRRSLDFRSRMLCAQTISARPRVKRQRSRGSERWSSRAVFELPSCDQPGGANR